MLNITVTSVLTKTYRIDSLINILYDSVLTQFLLYFMDYFFSWDLNFFIIPIVESIEMHIL